MAAEKCVSVNISVTTCVYIIILLLSVHWVNFFVVGSHGNVVIFHMLYYAMLNIQMEEVVLGKKWREKEGQGARVTFWTDNYT